MRRRAKQKGNKERLCPAALAPLAGEEGPVKPVCRTEISESDTSSVDERHETCYP